MALTPARTRPSATPPTSGRRRPWTRLEVRRAVAVLGVVVAMHALAWGTLVLAVAPQQLQVGTQVFGIGLGVTAYTLGVRHAFDADHIAAIDNTTRKLMADGQRPVTVGFWFALGHSTVVVVMALLVAAGTQVAGTLMREDSGAHQVLGVVATSTSGVFLYVIGIVNLVALVGIVRVFRRMRAGAFDEQQLERALDSRGLLARLTRRATGSAVRPWQMYPVGLVFGLGFDTASEIALLVLAGAGAASGLPWYAVLVLPLLFAAGMSLFDTLDGAFMNVAYDWAFANPIRKVYYNLTITGLSVAVAVLIGSIELITVLHDKLGLEDAVSGWVAGLGLDYLGYGVVGLFVVVWAVAVAYWKIARVETRWASPPASG
ncbi:Nickel transporter NicT [Angustibacter aerolatus]